MPHGRVVLILQARMDSTRLPGKTMMDLHGAPLLGRMLERVKRCGRCDEIVVATSRETQDDVIEDLAAEYSIACFRGSEHDVLDRYYQAAKAHDAGLVLRLPADNPVPEPEEIDRIIAYHSSTDNAYSSNLAEVLGNGYPDGIGAEAISFWALEKAWKTCKGAQEREHLHLSFYDYRTGKPTNPEVFKVGTVQCPEAFRRPDLVFDVNTEEEYGFIRALYDYLYPLNPQFHITDIIKWHDEVYRAGSGDAHGGKENRAETR